MTICLSHGGTTVFSSDAPSNDLLVATVDGVVFLKRDGAGSPWKVARKAFAGHHVIALMIEPISGTLFATTHDAGVAASKDFGQTWEFRNQGLISDNVYSITYGRSGDQVRLYAGTEPAHLFVSEDLGAHWRELPALRSVPSVPKWTFPAPPHDAHVINITVDPKDPQVIYACVEQGGLLKSVDGGASWKELEGFNDDCHRLLVLSSNTNRMYLPTGYGFYRSNDGGENWENISQRISRIGYPDPMVIHPRNENLMFVTGGEADPYHWMQTKSANPRIARSRDGGDTWEVLGKGMPERLDASFEAMALEAWDTGYAVYAGNTDGDIYCSDDEGESWSKIIEGIPAVSKTIHYTILRADLSFEKHQRPGV
jgi:photosystem II stability/assembly factor-like uncharacterized protein